MDEKRKKEFAELNKKRWQATKKVIQKAFLENNALPKDLPEDLTVYDEISNSDADSDADCLIEIANMNIRILEAVAEDKNLAIIRTFIIATYVVKALTSKERNILFELASKADLTDFAAEMEQICTDFTKRSDVGVVERVDGHLAAEATLKYIFLLKILKHESHKDETFTCKQIIDFYKTFAAEYL
ncbi:MAG: hypothetical protein GY793_08005 [Proteobacteria bacterium]|nr:hypothetical protein [Pseudomonadota bacterium]